MCRMLAEREREREAMLIKKKSYRRAVSKHCWTEKSTDPATQWNLQNTDSVPGGDEGGQLTS